ncbi:class I SAM-dependent methyltransferase [Gemella haemolysans]|uniref:class I SAM-dependent methyltransferase n=1 Tax=Gemella haemolysans TaxID=1379 RepID=UPI0019584106|nr:class I SAM-dependent methyltransferase [Gemella haemolysans]VTX76477.1 Methyltransferase domain protein [Gemella haemolysans]
MRNISNKKSVQNMAYKNYKNNNPWPENDNWHASTHSIIEKTVINWLNKNTHENSICLNIGAGQSRYSVHGTLIQMDIISEYIENEPNYIVGSLESIPLETESVDFIVCVGSVLNYCDAIRSISEIERVLKINGKAIIEFERSNSAEFLLTKNYSAPVFLKKYNYNNQQHLLWMYSEKYIKEILLIKNLKIKNIYRFHILSSLLYKLGLNEKKSSKFYKFDDSFQKLSYPFAHNVIIEITK